MIISPSWTQDTITNMPNFKNNSFTTKPYTAELPKTILISHAKPQFIIALTKPIFFVLYEMYLKYIILPLFLQLSLYFKPLSYLSCIGSSGSLTGKVGCQCHGLGHICRICKHSFSVSIRLFHRRLAWGPEKSSGNELPLI